MTPRGGFLGALLLGGMLVVSTTETGFGGGGARPSERVEHLDGTGVSIFTILSDQSEWTIENFWPNNSVNGTVGFPDDTTTFINCAPTNRTVEETSLDCRLYDAATESWGAPIATTVDREYLDGDFENLYNSLFGVTGEYVVFVDAPVNQTFRLQLLVGRSTAGGFPAVLGQTNPPTDAAFLLRDVDLPGGATGATNFTMGMQTGEYCIDLHATPTTPGGALAGTMDVRVQGEAGSCGEFVVEDCPTALLPSGDVKPGGGCAYELLSEADCLEALGGRNICLRCAETCPDLESPVVVIETGAGYSDCGAISVARVAGGTCSQSCDGVRGMVVVPLEG